MVNLAICICTYNRNKGLKKLLDSILLLKLDDKEVNLNIVVVDNATPPISQKLVEKTLDKKNIGYVWQHEKKQGISFARNRTVELSRNVDYYFFVDDDQILDEYCIEELLKVQSKFKADLVYGSNPPIFEKVNVPFYIKQYFQPDNIETGQKLLFAPTNCLLIVKGCIDANREPFDYRFAHTGGEDTFLTRSLVKNDALLIKASKALAYEIVPANRCNIKWILKRVLRESAIYSYQNRLLNESVSVNLLRSIKLIFKLISGIVLSPFIVLPVKYKINGLILIMDAIGGFLGYFSYKKKEYI